MYLLSVTVVITVLFSYLPIMFISVESCIPFEYFLLPEKKGEHMFIIDKYVTDALDGYIT